MFDRKYLITCLKELGKRVQKQFHECKVDIWIVGGANLVYRFDFRETTVDIDIIKNRAFDLRDIALSMEDEFKLPHNWINDSVMFSDSFSVNLRKYVSDVREFSHTLVCHFISPVAIACMKLRANRPEKGDLLDAYLICLDAHISPANLVDCYYDLYNLELPAEFIYNLGVLVAYCNRTQPASWSGEINRLLDLYSSDLRVVLQDIEDGCL